MKIKQVSITNFLAIGEATINLSDRGLLLLQGENEDDSSAKSNGSGKSSLVDAICWGLFGTTARGVTGDAVVNRTAGKGTLVHLTLLDEATDTLYDIIRHRKHRTGKNTLRVLKSECALGMAAPVPVDLTKGTDRETQVLVEQIIGCTLSVFQASIYAGQEQMPDLPGMTDKALKLLLEEAAGTEILGAAYTEALRRKLDVAETLNLATRQLATAERTVETLDAEVKVAKEQHAEFERGRKDRAKEHLGEAVASEAEAKLKREAASALPPFATLLAERSKLDVELGRAEGASAALGVAVKQATAAGMALAAAQSDLKTVTNVLTQRKDKLVNVKSLLGVPCDECGRPHTEADLAKHVEQQKDLLRAGLQAVVDAKAKVAALQRAHDDANKHADDTRAKQPDVSAQVKARSEIERQLNEGARLQEMAEFHAKTAERHRNDARQRLTEPNPHAEAVERLRKKLAETGEHVRHSAKLADEARRSLDIAVSVCEVFGPAGVRAHILDTVTPFLNDRTRDYLAALADGNIGAVWTTLSTTAKGELREKFTIEVSNDKGAESFAGLSGGEKRKVRLACAMALQDLVASRAVKPIRLWIADEIDDALDDAGLERLMTLLNDKAKERGTVMVISHKDLKDWIDQVIEVKKNGGRATVSGAI